MAMAATHQRSLERAVGEMLCAAAADVPALRGHGGDAFEVRVDDDDLDESEGLKNISGSAAIKNGPPGEILRWRATLISKNMIRKDFFGEMEAASEQAADLAWDLFVDNPVKNGSGAWGAELDKGELLLMEELSVHDEWRRKGLGTMLFSEIVQQARRMAFWRSTVFVLVVAGALTSDILREGRAQGLPEDHPGVAAIGRKSEETAKTFWRALGFRRVGDSSWFAWSPSPEHASRQLQAGNDHDPPERTDATAPLDPAWAVVFHGLRAAAPDDDDDDDGSLSALQTAWDCPQPCRLAVDKLGNTVAHSAALAMRPVVLRDILQCAPDLADARNAEGYTLLEALRRCLEKTRTGRGLWDAMMRSPGRFDGFGSSAVACMGILTGVQAPSAQDDGGGPGVAAHHATLRLKYGCTCGSCLGGFFSPRMVFALHTAAVVQYDHLADSVFEPEREAPDKEGKRGCVEMFRHVAGCLEVGLVPTGENVLEHMKPTGPAETWTKAYLKEGGTVAPVAREIIEVLSPLSRTSGPGTAPCKRHTRMSSNCSLLVATITNSSL